MNPALFFRLAKIKTWIDENNPGDLLIPFSGVLEQKVCICRRPECEEAIQMTHFDWLLFNQLSLMSPEERETYTKEIGANSALPKIIVAGYQALQLVYYFTGGADEVRAWTIRVRVLVPYVKNWRCHLPYDLLLCLTPSPSPHRK